MENAVGMDISGQEADIRPIVEMVPNFFDNTPSSPLFEKTVGKAELLFCGFDLEGEDRITQQFHASLCEYIAAER